MSVVWCGVVCWSLNVASFVVFVGCRAKVVVFVVGKPCVSAVCWLTFVDCCLLVVVCCLLFVVRCLLCVECCLLFWSLLFAGC